MAAEGSTGWTAVPHAPAPPSVSKVAQSFQRNAIDQDLLTVPGIGPANVKKLNQNGITHTDGLIAEFWATQRDVEKFVQLLVNYGLSERYARVCADEIAKKFRAL